MSGACSKQQDDPARTTGTCTSCFISREQHPAATGSAAAAPSDQSYTVSLDSTVSEISKLQLARPATPIKAQFTFAGTFDSESQKRWLRGVVHIVRCLFGNREFRTATIYPLFKILFVEQSTKVPTVDTVDAKVLEELDARIFNVDKNMHSEQHCMEALVPPAAFRTHTVKYVLSFNQRWMTVIDRVFNNNAAAGDCALQPLHTALGVIKLSHEIIHTLTPVMCEMEFQARNAMFRTAGEMDPANIGPKLFATPEHMGTIVEYNRPKRRDMGNVWEEELSGRGRIILDWVADDPGAKPPNLISFDVKHIGLQTKEKNGYVPRRILGPSAVPKNTDSWWARFADLKAVIESTAFEPINATQMASATAVQQVVANEAAAAAATPAAAATQAAPKADDDEDAPGSGAHAGSKRKQNQSIGQTQVSKTAAACSNSSVTDAGFESSESDDEESGMWTLVRHQDGTFAWTAPMAYFHQQSPSEGEERKS